MNKPPTTEEKLIKDESGKSRFEALLANFIYFVEDETKRIEEEKKGAYRRDGGRKMTCTIFLQQLLSLQATQERERVINDIIVRLTSRICEARDVVTGFVVPYAEIDTYLSTLKENK